MKSARPLHIAVLCCLLGASFLGCAQVRNVARQSLPNYKQDQETKLSFARAFESDGSLPKAEKIYRELEQADPKNAMLKHRLGLVLVRRGQVDEGFALLEKAKLMNPDNVALLNDMGYAYLLQGQFATAEGLLREALELEPKNARTVNNLGLAIGYAGRTDEAYNVFRQGMSEAEAYANIGFVHSQRGDVEQAMNWYNRSLTKDPTNKPAAQALVQLAELSKKLDKNKEAIAQKKEAASKSNVTQVASSDVSMSQIVAASAESELVFEPPIRKKVSQIETASWIESEEDR